MENNNWNNNDRRNKLWQQGHPSDNEVNPDSYRGAYRFDNESEHHNTSTWNGYGSTANRGQNRQHPDYNQNYNRDYNQDYNRNYNSPGYDHDNYNMDSRYRQHNGNYRASNSSDWGRQHDEEHHQRNYQQNRHPQQQHPSVHDRIEDQDPYGVGNFQADYGPDPYGQGGGENYGNEAGSLSYGYDGSSNYDPDWNRYYDPQTGHRRSYHGDYTSRHPETGNRQDDHRNSGRRHNSQDRY